MGRRNLLFALLVVAASATAAEAGHPFHLFWDRPAGPYTPQAGRYVVVDPTPVAGALPKHVNPADVPAEYWQRRESTPRIYPYGWFGAAPHASNSWSHTYYYDDYRDYRVLRGR